MLRTIKPHFFLALLLFSGSLYAQSDWQLKKGKPPNRSFVSVCLYQDKTSQGFFAPKDWKSLIASPNEKKCGERFLADVRAKELFFDFDSSFEWRGGRPDDALCYGTGTSYSGCTSTFFDYFPNGINKELNAKKALDALAKSNALAKLESIVKSQIEKEQAERYAQYKLDFTEADTLQAIEAFTANYVSSDVDGLIPKLEPLRLKLARAKYLNDYSAATTLVAMINFKTYYQTNDPDNLI